MGGGKRKTKTALGEWRGEGRLIAALIGLSAALLAAPAAIIFVIVGWTRTAAGY